MTKVQGLTQLTKKESLLHFSPPWTRAWNQCFKQDAKRGFGQRQTGKQLYRQAPKSPSLLSCFLPSPKSKKKWNCGAAPKAWAQPAAESRNPAVPGKLCDQCQIFGPFRAFARLRSPAPPSSPTLHSKSARSTPSLQTLPSPRAAQPPPGTHHRSPRTTARAGRPVGWGIRYWDSGSIRANNFSREVEGGGGRGARWWRQKARSFTLAQAGGGRCDVGPGDAPQAGGPLPSRGGTGPGSARRFAPWAFGGSPQMELPRLMY